MNEDIEHKPQKTILVVDDEELMRRLVQNSLARLNCIILEAISPEEALLVYETRSVGKLPGLDLLITDIRMPNPRQGIELIKAMVKRGYKGSAIIMSGTMEDYMQSDAEEFSFQGLQVVRLQKPFLPSVLIIKATELLTGSQQAS